MPRWLQRLSGLPRDGGLTPEFTKEWYSTAGSLLTQNASLLFLTAFGVPSSFLFLVMGLGSLVTLVIATVRPRGVQGQFTPAAYLIGGTLPTALMASWGGMLYDLVTPLTGRMGVIVPGDAVVGVVTAVFVSYTLLPLGPLFRRHARGAMVVSRSLALAGVVAIVAAAVWVVPFDRDHPKRMTVQHAIDVSTNR